MTSNIIIYDKDPDTDTPTVQVTIGHTKVEEVLSKALTTIPIPKSSSQFDIDTGANDVLLLDLLQVEHRYNVDGVISEGLGTANPTIVTNKTNLKKLFNAGGVVYVVYEGNTISANFEKLQITEVPEDAPSGSAMPSTFDVRFTMIKGANIG